MANPLLLGVAFQVGALPVHAASIERALELNGVAVERNLQAFRWGRRYAVDPVGTVAAAGHSGIARSRSRCRHRPPPTGSAHRKPTPDTHDLPPSVRRLVDIRVPELVDYQGLRLAHDYVAFVRRVVDAERDVVPGRTDLSEAVARHLFKLMAYKDEYEVARLALRRSSMPRCGRSSPTVGRVRYRLHPPVLRSLGMRRKLALGRWFRPGFHALRAMRRVRGTPFDVFGHTKVRRTERALVGEYRDLVEDAVGGLTPGTYERAVEIASLPDLVRGYERIKLDNVARFRADAERLPRRALSRAQECASSMAGCSTQSATKRRKPPASSPSMIRWSNDSDSSTRVRGTTTPSTTHGFSANRPTPRIAASGWLMIATPPSTPKAP